MDSFVKYAASSFGTRTNSPYEALGEVFSDLCDAIDITLEFVERLYSVDAIDNDKKQIMTHRTTGKYDAVILLLSSRKPGFLPKLLWCLLEDGQFMAASILDRTGDLFKKYTEITDNQVHHDATYVPNARFNKFMELVATKPRAIYNTTTFADFFERRNNVFSKISRTQRIYTQLCCFTDKGECRWSDLVGYYQSIGVDYEFNSKLKHMMEKWFDKKLNAILLFVLWDNDSIIMKDFVEDLDPNGDTERFYKEAKNLLR